MPKAERVLWNKLKGKQLLCYKFRRQHGIGAYIVDFYCTELRLVIEVDGDSHMTPEAIFYDSRRDDFMKNNDIYCLRFTNAEIYQNLENVIKKIEELAEVLSRNPS